MVVIPRARSMSNTASRTVAMRGSLNGRRLAACGRRRARRNVEDVVAEFEPARAPAEAEGEVRPQRRVAAVAIDVVALAAAAVPHRALQVALDLCVVGLLHLRPHL